MARKIIEIDAHYTPFDPANINQIIRKSHIPYYIKLDGNYQKSEPIKKEFTQHPVDGQDYKNPSKSAEYNPNMLKELTEWRL